MAMRPMFFVWLFVLFTAGVPSCTVDEDVVEGKKCERVTSDPTKGCVKGYECMCEQSSCVCRKKINELADQVSASGGTKGLVSSSLSPAAPSAPAAVDPNYLFLRQRGLFQE